METIHLDAVVTINGGDVLPDDVHDLSVELDLDQPDMASVTISNQSTKWSEAINVGDPIEIKLGFVGGAATASVFKGEVTGIEPIYDTRSPSRVTLRALNALHVLTRGKKSVTYQNVSDKDIVSKICSNAGLSPDFGSTPPTTQYDHVYQDNLTDLEFIRMRAARIGYQISLLDKKLSFVKRSDSDSGLTLALGAGGDDNTTTLERFLPRLTTAHQVSEVVVYGWDHEKKQTIVGSAKPASSKLGDKTGADTTNSTHSGVTHVQSDAPVRSKEEADNLAKSILQERMMSYITGDGVSRGNPKLKPGIVVTINAQDKRFNGKYFLTAVRHRYTHAGATGGYRTEFKFRRDAASSTS